MALLTHDEVRPSVKSLKAKVVSREMAPKGNPADLPASPFASGWQGGEPDYVFEMPGFEVPAEDELPALYFLGEEPVYRGHIRRSD